MHTTVLVTRRVAAGLALVAALAAPMPASAQSQLDASQAQAFMGSWVINMSTDFGPMVITMSIQDQGGKVAASVGSPEMGGTTEVTDITLQGANLVLKYDIDAQGQFIDVSMNLEPAGANLNTVIEAAGGQFTTTAVATRAQG
jgi:hypothetical protein